MPTDKATFDGEIVRMAITKKPGQDGGKTQVLQVVLEAPASALTDLASLVEARVRVSMVPLQGRML